ncbi:CBO0543 family protein [Bacillus sp. B15-48]|uniref:CBO0543 family protein n=1 Tax=Bacillus sp. B15-48 TaxID=1548601 RepID=UPI00193ED457|nr:CBO0543 family protein [Bacillus sp. B15-48]MBM4761478.1 hypothetical protein [Bacillus sp. B15-48]
MVRGKCEKKILLGLLGLGIGLLPFVFRRTGLKDWLLVFFASAFSNGVIDKIIVANNFLKYPVRLLPKYFQVHILFDALLYPLVNIMYNQLTLKDNHLIALFKLFYFIIPMVVIEVWAERRTKLIEFKRGWRWYHSFVSLMVKSFFSRFWIRCVQKWNVDR